VIIETEMKLANVPSVLFLFGKSGAGKSYVGNIIAQKLGWHVYDADDDITVEMQMALKEKRPFTNEMRDQYFPIVVENILSRLKLHEHLIVTQGVYKQRHRLYLKSRIPNLELVFVDASEHSIGGRLVSREKGIDNESANALANDFEFPKKGTKVITNNGGTKEILEQLIQLFPDIA
jgi:gluconate kinase